VNCIPHLRKYLPTQTPGHISGFLTCAALPVKETISSDISLARAVPARQERTSTFFARGQNQ
jgi:hypothetical protein